MPRCLRLAAEKPGDVVFASHSMGAGSHLDLEGDRFELRVVRSGGVDLRGWRVTDNDYKTATDEGSLVFGTDPALARVPRGTVIRVVVPRRQSEPHPQDDLDARDRQMTLYVGNGTLDASLDPGFNLGVRDNLALLAPGPTAAFDDDRGIAFIANSPAVTPATFGVLTDGVTFPE